MDPVQTSSRKRGLSLATALATVMLLAALSIGSASAQALSPVPPCPSFRVLHNDRIGAAVLPAGEYRITTASPGMTCAAAARLFTRFLSDYDGALPQPWRVIAEGGGKASFSQSGKAGFSVARRSNETAGGNSEAGVLCRAPFSVNSNVVVGPLEFPEGAYVIYIPPRSGISCNRASVLFARFLGAPGGRLPFPWRLQNQTATFFKPEHPVRSAFRVEPA